MASFLKVSLAMLRSPQFAGLPHSAKAAYPAIGCHCNRYGEAWPGQDRIADLAGIDRKTVCKGITALEKMTWFRTVPGPVNRFGKRRLEFKLTLPGPKAKGVTFFYNELVKSGLWARLSMPAKSFYWALRAYCFFDLEATCNDGEPDEWYRNREAEIVEADEDVLASHAGIGIRTLRKTLSELEDYDLVDQYSGQILVWLRMS